MTDKFIIIELATRIRQGPPSYDPTILMSRLRRVNENEKMNITSDPFEGPLKTTTGYVMCHYIKEYFGLDTYLDHKIEEKDLEEREYVFSVINTHNK
jgi:hypothetical protein